MDDENEGNPDGNPPMEEDGAVRRNQVLIFGVVFLGILAICLAVSLPSDLEFSDPDMPTSAGPISMSPEVSERSPLVSVVDPKGKGNQTNATSSRKKTIRNSDVSVEVQLLRDMAIQKKIQEYDNNVINRNIREQEDRLLNQNHQSKEEALETKKVESIVETFVQSSDFEDFLIDMEIHDAVKKLREEKGYKSRSSTLFDEIFKRAEREFIGEDEEELRLIRRVGEELEKRAREVIAERKKTRGEVLTEPEKMLADELLKLDFSGSSGDEENADQVRKVYVVREEENDDGLSEEENVNGEEDIVEIKKTEL